MKTKKIIMKYLYKKKKLQKKNYKIIKMYLKKTAKTQLKTAVVKFYKILQT